MEMKAEALKLYNCQFFDSFRGQVNSLFDKTKLHSVTDYYHTSIMNRELEQARYDESGFRPILKEKMESEWVKLFDAEKFSLGSEKGVTLDTIRLVHMMSAYKHGDEKVTKAVKTLIKHASSTSQDELSESQIFFLAPKMASSMDLDQLNYYFAEILKF